MLEKLGIHGYGAIERSFLAGLVLGEPILLWGTHGAAKTELCRRASQALGLSFWAYDASKSLFEDVLGFPNPAQLSKGRVDYVRTPLSIWDKQAVLVDELNRANPQLQSRWMELIYARQIMGCPLPELRQVFAAMNPPTYLGTNPLDEALAGRFAAMLRVPELKDMPEREGRAVLRARCGASLEPEQAASFRGLLQRARSIELDEATERAIEDYVFEVIRVLHARDVVVDGRRAGMMVRLVAARRAVETALEPEPPTLASSGRVFLDALKASLPFQVCGREVAASTIRTAHEVAFAAVSGGQWVRVLRLPADPVSAARAFRDQHAEVALEERHAGVTRVLTSPAPDSPMERRAASVAGVEFLARDVSSGAVELDPDDEYRVLDARRRQLRVPEPGVLLRELAAGQRSGQGPRLDDARGLLALRAAATLVEPPEGPPHPMPYGPPWRPPVPLGTSVRDVAREVREQLDAAEEETP